MVVEIQEVFHFLAIVSTAHVTHFGIQQAHVTILFWNFYHQNELFEGKAAHAIVGIQRQFSASGLANALQMLTHQASVLFASNLFCRPWTPVNQA